jgi:hypothetical protein
MMMDPSTMDEYTREWWDLAYMGVLQQTREAAAMAHAEASNANRGVGAMVSGGGVGVNDPAVGGHT